MLSGINYLYEYNGKFTNEDIYNHLIRYEQLNKKNFCNKRNYEYDFFHDKKDFQEMLLSYCTHIRELDYMLEDKRISDLCNIWVGSIKNLAPNGYATQETCKNFRMFLETKKQFEETGKILTGHVRLIKSKLNS